VLSLLDIGCAVSGSSGLVLQVSLPAGLSAGVTRSMDKETAGCALHTWRVRLNRFPPLKEMDLEQKLHFAALLRLVKYHQILLVFRGMELVAIAVRNSLSLKLNTKT
jgi:hypothetical protein